MAEKSPLRRWKRFLPAFGAIDAAIEAATHCSRDNHRQVRGDIVEILCDVTGNDSVERAEWLCQLLDEAMVEALETLRVVEATPTLLATTNVIEAVGDLLSHESGRVRGLACTIIGVWTTFINGKISRCRVIFGKLSQIDQEQEAVCVPVATDLPVQRDKKQWLCAKKKMSPVGVAVGRIRSEQTGDAKRKFPGGYCREEDDQKRQRNKNVVRQVVDQRPRKTTSKRSERKRASYWKGASWLRDD
jgi:hypothetical protein